MRSCGSRRHYTAICVEPTNLHQPGVSVFIYDDDRAAQSWRPAPEFVSNHILRRTHSATKRCESAANRSFEITTTRRNRGGYPMARHVRCLVSQRQPIRGRRSFLARQTPQWAAQRSGDTHTLFKVFCGYEIPSVALLSNEVFASLRVVPTIIHDGKQFWIVFFFLHACLNVKLLTAVI